MEGWKKIAHKGLLELWKTPTKWLVCRKHERKFKFFNTKREADKFFEEDFKEKP